MDVAVRAVMNRMMSRDNNLTFDRTTDSLEAIAAALGVGPSVGLWMFGIVDATQVGSTTVITLNNLQNIPNDLLEGQFWMQVLYDASAPGTAPEGEIREITNFVQGGALQTFTVDAFSANIDAGDFVCIFHESLLSHQILGFGTLDTSSATVPADSTRAAAYAWENDEYFRGALLMPITGNCRFQPRPIGHYVAAPGVFTLAEPFSQAPGAVDYVIVNFAYPSEAHEVIDQIFALIRAMLVLTETSGTLTSNGAEQDIYVNNAPAGVFEPKVVKIDMTNNAVADTVVVRLYYRIVGGGNMILQDTIIFAGHQVIPLKKIKLDPNRFGVQVTLERTVGGAQNYDWEVLYKD